MISQYIRALKKTALPIEDISLELQDETRPLINLLSGEYLYIGQNFPFNNFYMQIDALDVNSNASNIIIELWDGRLWRSAIDILDGTKTTGVTLAKSGVVQFSPDRDYVWHVENNSKDIPDLVSTKIYDLYWARISFTADLSATTRLRTLSYCFTQEKYLMMIDPEINKYLKAWGGATKLNWQDQILIATMHVIDQLKTRQIITSAAQILRFDDLVMPTAYKTLHLIYSPLGNDFQAKRDEFYKQIDITMRLKPFVVDTNLNAITEASEIAPVLMRGKR